jgi:trans-aconitate 2-methyltransferase
MRLSLTSLLLVLATPIFSEQDPWKGDEYAKNSESQKNSADDFLKGTKLSGNESILDVGCGDGKITAALARKVPQGKVVGVDISSSMIGFALKSFSEQKNLSFEVKDAAEITYQNQFDLVTSFTVMQWVLEQEKALQAFEKALKPGGKLWIQMPTGLPSAMKQALNDTLSKDEWKGYFVNFTAPWRFYQLEEYRPLLISAKFTPTRLEVTTKKERFPSRDVFQGFLSQWFPYLRALPAELKNKFLTDLLDRYVALLPPDEQGGVFFIVDRLEVEAIKG